MKTKEVIERLQACDESLEIVVRGECLGRIADIYIDYNHGDDSPFIAIDIDQEEEEPK